MPGVSLTYRTNDGAKWGTGAGANLTPAQIDNNFWAISKAIESIQTNSRDGVGIANIVMGGDGVYFTLQDGRQFGPFDFTRQPYVFMGAWFAGTLYNKNDVVSVAGQGVYVVLIQHTANYFFDPAATDAAGNPLYGQMLAPPTLYFGNKFYGARVERAGDVISASCVSRGGGGVWVPWNANYDWSTIHGMWTSLSNPEKVTIPTGIDNTGIIVEVTANLRLSALTADDTLHCFISTYQMPDEAFAQDLYVKSGTEGSEHNVTISTGPYLAQESDPIRVGIISRGGNAFTVKQWSGVSVRLLAKLSEL